MARNNRKNKGSAPKQGHKLVWITLILIAVPFLLIFFVIQGSVLTQSTPVVGSRFGSNDLNPEISDDQIPQIKDAVSSIDNVDSVTVNLKSATLRINMNMSDDADEATIKSAADEAYNKVDDICPINTYFTNSDDGKMYDLEINCFNYLVDDTHTSDGQIFIEITKTGAGKKQTDNMTTAKDEELVNEIQR
jgi:hypothetical protein